MREKDEVRQGYIPGAVHVPRGFLEMQAEQKLPSKTDEIIVYCAGGTRSAFAAKTLSELGYEHVISANPGFVRWKDLKYPVELPADLTPAQLDRYSRHILLPEVGERGQEKLLKGRVLLLGAGGLGAPGGIVLGRGRRGSTLRARWTRTRWMPRICSADHPTPPLTPRPKQRSIAQNSRFTI